jgi:tetrapyrrole methylase family protein/MazG family protein
MPPGIIIVGLGPGDPGLLTRQAWEVLQRADEVYLRTGRHPVVRELPTQVEVHTFDALYERLDSFAEVYDTIAAQVVALGRRAQGVIYAVPGTPFVAEASVQRILAQADAARLPIRIVAGLSFVEPVLACLKVDALAHGLQLADATELAARHHPSLDVDQPALVAQLYSRDLASDVKLTLLNAYPAGHPVSLVQRASSADVHVRTISLFELDRQPDLDDWTSLYVPPLERPSSVTTLQDVVAHLRAPDGCPWDREQTHQTLRPYLLEETYEVLAALDADDPVKLREELGDLLLQVLMHTQMASESSEFSLADVVADIVAKLIRRHPHVFGQVQVANAGEVLRNWEYLKQAERIANGEKKGGPFAGIALELPALARSQELQERATRLGWQPEQVVDGAQRLAARLVGLDTATDEAGRSRAVGEFLFDLVGLARRLGVNAESALREANARFAAGFQATPADMQRKT